MEGVTQFYKRDSVFIELDICSRSWNQGSAEPFVIC